MSGLTRRLQRCVQVAGATTYSLWPTNPTPSVEAESDTSSVEIGVKFQSSMAATVTGIRFYKGVGNSGTHTGNLWSASGTLLATTTFTGETTTGWQTAYFSSPVPISAGTTYVASYFAPSGHYAADSAYFASTAHTSGILTAPADTTTSNGVFSYSATSIFPSGHFNATNYWVDIVVEGQEDSIAPSVPTGLNTSSLGSSASLTWNASTDNVGVESYIVYRDSVQIGTSATTSYLDTTTSPSTAYTYTVRAKDYSGNTSALSAPSSITTGTNDPPTASFSISTSGLTISVNASASTDTDGTITSYTWDWGDASPTENGMYASHTYAADNSYTIVLTVVDNNGASDSDSQVASLAAGSFQSNLIFNPSLGGYPDETNTGVPVGTSLTNSGSVTISTDGAVLQNLDISGQVIVQADNVTIRNCRITSGDYYPIDHSGSNLLVEDCEITGTNYNVTSCLSFDSYTIRRCNISGGADGLKANSDVLIEDCFIHSLAIGPETHNDGTQTTGGSNVTIRHNTYRLGDVAGVNACLQIGNEGGTNSNWLVEDNLFDGGGWVINASNVPANNPNFEFYNNRFTRRSGYGVGGVGGAVWTGNYFDDDGTPA
ncbi:DUF4082 domain-containing protein [Candidatus Saccharibacteria bacterium]|nr:DUF4082 domain-containing protein [Candidatus Saccharibacteria bacterium]